MRTRFLATLGAVALLGIGPVSAGPGEGPQAAAKKGRCKGAQKNLGSRIKRASTCDAAGDPVREPEERLPISLQIKPPQADPGQRRPPQ